MTNENVSRRSIAKGAAWGVPVLTMAAAAPAAAASAVPAVAGASYYFDDFKDHGTSGTITGEIRPLQAEGACGYSVTNGPASVANLSATYWLPVSSYTFSARTSSSWSLLKLDSTKGTRVGPTTGLTYYPYTTTYAGTGSTSTTCGPSYSFVAPAVTTTIRNPNGSYFYQLAYTLNGVAKTNPLRSVNNP